MRKTTLLGLGAVLLIIISIFLPILSIGGISAGLFDAGQRGKEIAYVILVFVALMGLFAFLANKKHLASIGTLIFAGVLGAIAMVFFNETKAQGGDIGMGVILMLVGTVLGLVSAFLGFMKK